jgi:hypothetical protein
VGVRIVEALGRFLANVALAVESEADQAKQLQDALGLPFDPPVGQLLKQHAPQ